MPEKITKQVARKSLKVALFSEAKQKYVSYVCGPLGAQKNDIFVMSRKNIAAVKSEAKQLYWEKSKEEFKAVAFGACRLENGTLYIRTEGGGKGAATIVASAARKYFKLHHKLPLFWMRVVKEDEPILNETFLSDIEDETGDLISDVELEGALANAETKFGDAVSDPEGNETVDESSGNDLEDSHVEDEPKTKPSIDARLEADIRTQIEEIVKNLLVVAAAIGLKVASAEADIVAKLVGWLERLLAGLSPAEQAVAAANWLARLQLAISSSVQAMRDSTVVSGTNSSSEEGEDETSDKSEEAEAGHDDSTIIPGVDLTDVTTEVLNDDEVVKAVFDKAVDLLGDIGSEYDISSASDQEARNIVKANKAKWQTDDTAAAIRRMFQLLQLSKFANRQSVADFLKLRPSAARQPESFHPSEILEWIAQWKTDHSSAVEQVERVKDAAEKALKEEDESLSVAKLGGDWKYVDDIFAQVDAANVEAELREVMDATNDNRVAAIKKASATFKANLDWLSANHIVELVDNAPFDGAEATVGRTLGSSLEGLVARLSKLEANAA